MVGDAQLILAGGGLLAAGVVASTVAARLRLPALILFLALGMAVGSDGLGWIDFANYSLARLVGTIALVLILFEGGLATGFRALRPVLGPAVSLAAIGTVGSAAITGLAASWLLHFSIGERTAARRDPVADRWRGGVRAAARGAPAATGGADARG